MMFLNPGASFHIQLGATNQIHLQIPLGATNPHAYDANGGGSKWTDYSFEFDLTNNPQACKVHAGIEMDLLHHQKLWSTGASFQIQLGAVKPRACVTPTEGDRNGPITGI